MGFTVNSSRARSTGSGKMKRNGSEKTASVYTLERKKKVGTELIFIRSVPKVDHRRLWTFLFGTDKTRKYRLHVKKFIETVPIFNGTMPFFSLV